MTQAFDEPRITRAMRLARFHHCRTQMFRAPSISRLHREMGGRPWSRYSFVRTAIAVECRLLRSGFLTTAVSTVAHRVNRSLSLVPSRAKEGRSATARLMHAQSPSPPAIHFAMGKRETAL